MPHAASSPIGSSTSPRSASSTLPSTSGSGPRHAARSAITCSGRVRGCRDASTAARSRDWCRKVMRTENGRENGYALLSILMLEVWLSEYLPRAVGAGARSAKSREGDRRMTGVYDVYHAGPRRSCEPALADVLPGGADGTVPADGRSSTTARRTGRSRSLVKHLQPSTTGCGSIVVCQARRPPIARGSPSSGRFMPRLVFSSSDPPEIVGSTSTLISQSNRITSSNWSGNSTPILPSASRAGVPLSFRPGSGGSAT